MATAAKRRRKGVSRVETVRDIQQQQQQELWRKLRAQRHSTRLAKQLKAATERADVSLRARARWVSQRDGDEATADRLEAVE